MRSLALVASATLVAVMLFAPSSASAQTTGPAEVSPADDTGMTFERLSFRLSSWPLQMEFSQWKSEGIDKVLHFDILTLEIGATFGGGWTVELSGALMVQAITGLGGSAALRGGYAFALSGGEEGALRSTYLVPLLGYRFAKRPAGDDGFDLYQITHSVQAGLAFDVFAGRRTAFTMRLFGAYEYAFASRAVRFLRGQKVRHSLQYGILIGFAFRQLGD